MLWCVCVLNYADRQAIFSVFPLLKAEMHLSDYQLGVMDFKPLLQHYGLAEKRGMIQDKLTLTEAQKLARPDVYHPILRRHPRTGRTSPVENGGKL